MPSHETDPKVVERVRNIRRAVDLRISGHNYNEIAEKLGVSRSTAHQYVKEGLEIEVELTADSVLEWKRTLLVSYRAILKALFPTATDGSINAALAFIKVGAEVSALLGLKALVEGTTDRAEINRMSREELRKYGIPLEQLGLDPEEVSAAVEDKRTTTG